MDKNSLVKAYIYIIASLTIGIAIYNIMTFFGGVGLALVGFSVLLIFAVTNILKSGEYKKRFGDLYIVIVLEAVMMLFLFFVVDFRTGDGISKFGYVLKNIISVYSIIAMIYVLFRFFSELNGKRYTFVEYMLGNYTPTPREKKAKKVKPSKAEVKKNKELENGTLEPKPISVEEESEAVEKEREVVEENVENTEEIPQNHSSNNDNQSNNWY